MIDDFDEVLTDKQAGVVRSLLRGDTVKEIARQRSLSPSTIQEHKRAALSKLGCSNTRQLFENFAPDGLENGTYGRSRYTGHSKRVDQGTPTNASGHRDDAGIRKFEDAGSFGKHFFTEPRIVPEVLDGKNATLMRFVVIGGIVFGVLAILALAITVLQTLGEVM